MERGEGEFTLHPLLALDIRAPGSQAFRLELNGTSSLPGSPVCRWHLFQGIFPTQELIPGKLVFKSHSGIPPIYAQTCQQCPKEVSKRLFQRQKPSHPTKEDRERVCWSRSIEVVKKTMTGHSWKGEPVSCLP